MKKLCIVSMFHNSSRWYDEFISKILDIDYPKEDLTYLFSESDSEDDTVARLNKTKQENPDRNIIVHTFLNEGSFTSYYEKLSYCHEVTQKILMTINGIELVLWMDSDVLIFPRDFVKKLVLQFDNPVLTNIGGIAAMCCQEHRQILSASSSIERRIQRHSRKNYHDIYYDWGGFKRNGRNFSTRYPYFPDFKINKIFKVDSMGMCFMVRRECFPMTFFHSDVGRIKSGAPIIHWNVAFEQLSKKFSFYLDTSMRVYHLNHVERGIELSKKHREDEEV